MDCDFVVIGAGMAGLSAAAELAAHGSVIVLEQEDQPAYHSTGRSAALFTLAYGNGVIRKLAACSRPFLDAPPQGFSDQPLLNKRHLLMVASSDQREAFDEALAESRDAGAEIRELDPKEATERVPVLRREAVERAFLSTETRDIDVHALQTGYVRLLRERGGRLACGEEVKALERANGGWAVRSQKNTIRAPVVVNAAGSWADVVAEMAGVQPVGLVPKRRTAILFDPPSELPTDTWPMVVAADESWYFKPDAGKILASPADETPSPPCDAQPEELDVAICVDRLERATRFDVRQITHRWAGLRTFATDKSPVCGFEAGTEGFFWLAGQGGYGIKTSPALAAVATALIVSGKLPEPVENKGVLEGDLAPGRLRS